MEIEQIENAIDERDEAIRTDLKALDEKNTKLEKKNLELADRLVQLEQREGPDFIPDMKKAPEFSLQKVMRHLSNPRDNLLDGYEAEMHQELSGKAGFSRPNAVMIPLQTKAYVDYNTPNFNSPLASAGGSNLVETVLHKDLIDVLREESVIMGLNPTVINATGDLDIPKKTSGTTGYWFGADGGDSITESTPIFTALEMRPKFVAALTRASYKMMLQTGQGIEGILQRDMMAVLAEAFDLAALQGTGSNSQPTGILNQSGILTDTWTGSPAAFLWDDVLEMERLLITNKSLRGNLSALADPVTYKTTKNTVKSSGDSVGFLAESDGSMNSYPLKATTHMPANTVLFGNWSELIVVNWGSIALEVDHSTGFATGVTAFRAILPVDFGIRHPESFCLSTLS
jgi:HK97 family phage major capsid protein